MSQETWRKRTGIEPARDGEGRLATVLKTAPLARVGGASVAEFAGDSSGEQAPPQTPKDDSGTIGAADPVERALADALARASAAGEWSVVAQLARELEARRAARAKVIPIGAVAKRG